MAEGFLLRVKYIKRGRLAYLSHLETIRSMERCIRRAHLPYAITEGFNPHMKVAFGPALPVGAASEGEYLDLRLKEYLAPADALERLRSAAAADLMPTDCGYVPMDAEALTVVFPVSDWRAEFEGCSLDALEAAFTALIAQGSIEVIRKRKKPKQVEFEGRLVDGPHLKQIGDRVVLTFSTQAQADGSLRPDRFIAAAIEGMDPVPQLVALTRTLLRG